MEWKTISSEYISKHIYFTARKDVCQKPDGSIVEAYYVVEMLPSVCAVALTENNEVLMARQYRHPIKRTILELPGGFIDAGEAPEQAVVRELLEETGYEFNEYEFLGKIAANPGVLENYTHMFLAKGGKKVKEQSLDPNEDIEIVLIQLSELEQMLKRNEIVQSLHASCAYYALERLKVGR